MQVRGNTDTIDRSIDSVDGWTDVSPFLYEAFQEAKTPPLWQR